jgi:hypothetical protein
MMNMLKSKFRFFGFMPAFFFCLIIYIMARGASSFMEASMTNDPVLDMICWVGLGELRTKALAVNIQKNGLICSRSFYGLGPEKVFKMSDFDGFHTSMLASKSNTFEYLYLMKGNKKVLKLSEYYHKNYDDLKATLEKEVTNLGEIPFSLVDEFKEMVR